MTRKQSTEQNIEEVDSAVQADETANEHGVNELGEVNDPTNDGPEEVFSPYKATDYVNAFLKESGLTMQNKDGDTVPKALPAQMLYRYVQDARIKAAKNEQGKWEIALSDLVEWLLAYTTKQLALQAKKLTTTEEVKEVTETVDEFEEVQELEPSEA